ncbi:MAG: glycosyltransferase, partial [Ilumatobacteraceae bacterium]
MGLRVSPTQRRALRAARKLARRAIDRRAQLALVAAALAGAGTGVALESVVLAILLGLGGVLVALSWALWLEVQSSRVIIAKGLQRLGVRFLPGQSRYEQRSPQVGRLVERAWEGHVNRGLAGLTALAQSPTAHRVERADAHLALADRHLAHGQPGEAAHHLRALGAEKSRRLPLELSIFVAEVASLDATAAPDLVAAIPAAHKRRMARDTDLGFFTANLEPADGRLAHLNRLLGAAGLEPVTCAPLTFGNITCDAPARSVTGGQLVSVIVPVYNAAGTIEHSLRSVLAQTWNEIVVLVVDDASTDDSVRVVEQIATGDPRVRLLTQNTTQGAYAARNRGLAEARGEFLTVHDADDWSHPRQIERQVRRLVARPRLQANLSALVRATKDVVWVRRDLTHGQVIGVNTSSLLFRRAVTHEVGGWDDVRSGGDSEFVDRLRALNGESAVEQVDPTIPLTIALRDAGSLTSSATTGLASQLTTTGARRLYRIGYSAWHASPAFRDQLPLARTADHWPFPAPASMRRRENRTHFDVIIMSDFGLPGGTTSSNLEEVKANTAGGLTTGLVHNRHPRFDSAVVNPKVLAACSDSTRFVNAHEIVSCDVLVIKHPTAAAEIPDNFPKISVNGNIVMVVNQTPMTGYQGDAEFVYDIVEVDAEIQRAFGRVPLWAPLSPVVRDVLHTHHAAEIAGVQLWDDDWVEIIDPTEWARPKHPPVPGKIRIGRHARDSVWKWPATKETILAAYPDDPDVIVDILGGADVAREVLGCIPGNWIVREFGSMDPADYLAGLDYFLYVPHPDMVEAFGRTLLEAWAAGVPVLRDVPTAWDEAGLAPVMFDTAAFATAHTH